MRSVVSRLRARRIERRVREQKRFYGSGLRPREISSWQLERLNGIWKSLRHEIPRLRQLDARVRLPEAFASWQHFRDVLPVMERAAIQRDSHGFVQAVRQPDSWRTTGGSTAQPLKFPVWKSETEVASSNIWLGAQAYDANAVSGDFDFDTVQEGEWLTRISHQAA